MLLHVQCYAGYKGDERPVRFQLDGRECVVEEILDQWYGPDGMFFRVRAGDGAVYVIRHRHGTDEWTLESVRQA